MAARVMPLNMIKLRRFLKRRQAPVQVAHPFMQVRIPAANVADVALKVLHVHGVEAHQRHVQPDVCLGDVLAKVVRSLCLGSEMLLCAVESLEQSDDGRLVGLGAGGEAGPVDAVVDEVVRPLVGLFDLALEALWVENNGAVLFLN